MPLPDQSRVSSSIPRITDIIARHHAVGIAACKQGQVVALHLMTTRGVVVITTSLQEFTEKCRGPRDHNGNRFPGQDEKRPIDRESSFAEFPAEGSSVPRPARSQMPPDELAKYIAAAKDVLSNRYDSKSAAARAHGLTENCFHSWLRSAVALELLPALKPAEEPVLKPNGKIL